MLLVSDDGACLAANAAASRLLRIARERLVETGLGELVAVEQRARVRALWADLPPAGHRSAAIVLRRPDGSRVEVDQVALANVRAGVHLALLLSPVDVGPGAKPRDEPLTRREREVLGLAARGATTAAIARQLRLSQPTVKTHVRNAMERLGAQTRTHAVALALSRGEIAL